MINELQRNAVFRNTNMAAAHLVGAQAQAMQDAAKNVGGAMTGFMGINMAQGGGMNAAQLFQMGAQQQVQQQPAPAQQSAGDRQVLPRVPRKEARRPRPSAEVLLRMRRSVR